MKVDDHSCTGTADMIVPDSWARLMGVDRLMSDIFQSIVFENGRALKRMQSAPERMLYSTVADRNVIRSVHSRSRMDSLN